MNEIEIIGTVEFGRVHIPLPGVVVVGVANEVLLAFGCMLIRIGMSGAEDRLVQN